MTNVNGPTGNSGSFDNYGRKSLNGGGTDKAPNQYTVSLSGPSSDGFVKSTPQEAPVINDTPKTPETSQGSISFKLIGRALKKVIDYLIGK